MSIHVLTEDQIVEMLGDSIKEERMSPRRCERCSNLLIPKLESGRVLFICHQCETPRPPE